MKIDQTTAVAIGLMVCGAILSDRVGWHAIWLVALLALVGMLSLIALQVGRFLLSAPSERWRRLRILETDYGRNAGWFVELDGRRIAVLSCPRHVEMFWVSYHVEPLIEDTEERSKVLSDRNWWDNHKLLFRNRELNETAAFAFAAGDAFDEAGRIWMRGLYLNADEPNLWERLLLHLRQRRKKPEE